MAAAGTLHWQRRRTLTRWLVLFAGVTFAHALLTIPGMLFIYALMHIDERLAAAVMRVFFFPQLVAYECGLFDMDTALDLPPKLIPLASAVWALIVLTLSATTRWLFARITIKPHP